MSEHDATRAVSEPGYTLRIGKDYYERREFYIHWSCYGYAGKGRGWRKPWPWVQLWNWIAK